MQSSSSSSSFRVSAYNVLQHLQVLRMREVLIAGLSTYPGLPSALTFCRDCLAATVLQMLPTLAHMGFLWQVHAQQAEQISAVARTTAAANGWFESTVAGIARQPSISVPPARVRCTLQTAVRRLQDSSTAAGGDDSATATATAGAGTNLFNEGSSCAAAAAAIRLSDDG
jgi:hypothetical protein